MEHRPPITRTIGRLARKIRRRIDRLTSEEGVFSGSQGRVLHFILANSDGLFQKDIERAFGFRPPTASELLKTLEAQGLISRKAAKDDARYKEIRPTEKALLYKPAVINGLRELERQATAGLSEQELAELRRILEIMAQNLS